MSEELCLVVVQIAHGVARRYSFAGDLEDFGNDCVLSAMQRMGNIDPERNCFSYLTQCCKNLYLGQYRKAARESLKHRQYHQAKKRPGGHR
jgi:DNA-directed RNA polymerase specialized sigma24 family protein